MAALEVVKKQLNEAGLGEFCLEVHSTKANKKDVLESLRKRLELQPPLEPSTLDQAIEEHQRHHEQLTRYVGLLNRPFGNSGKSIQQLFWGAIHATDRAKALALPAGLDDVLLPNALDLTIIALHQRRDALKALEQLSTPIVATYGMPNHHPWAGMRRTDLSPFEQEIFIRALESWHDSLLSLEEKGTQASTDLGITGLTTIDDIRNLTEAIALLPHESDAIISDILPKLKNAEVLRALEQFITLVQNAQELLNLLHVKVEDTVGCLPQADAVRGLDTERHKLTVGAQIFDGRVEELPTLAERYRQFAQAIAAHITTAIRLLRAAGMSTTVTAHTLATLLDAIDQLRSTPRLSLRGRSAALLDEAARSVLERAVSDARDIN
jgi:hypothetical protein